MRSTLHGAYTRLGQRSLVLVTFVLAAAMAHAQLVYITQPSMRTWFNNRAAGSVDANGYLNTTDPGLLDITDTYMIVHGTITQVEGLAYLPNLTELNMYSNDSCDAYTIDGWPPNLNRLDWMSVVWR